MEKILGLINLHNSSTLDTLTSRRPLASTGFLGRYAFIDIALSNLINSGISEIGIMIKDKPRSLFRHLGFGGNQWSQNYKTGQMVLMYNETHSNNSMYNHDINNIIENIWFIKNSSSEYVVITPVHIIDRLNYQDVVKDHISKNADITVVYAKVENAKDNYIGTSYLRLDKNNRIIRISENKGSENDRNISLETIVMNKKTLLEIIDKASKISSFFSMKDILQYLCGTLYINAYEYKGYVRFIDSVQSYLNVSLELLEPKNFQELFSVDWPVYTRTYDTPPTKYYENAKVSKSFIANGSMIKGTVKNSVIGRDVIVEKGAVVENSILLSHVRISENTHLNYVVVDKEAEILTIKELVGSRQDPLIVKQEDVI